MGKKITAISLIVFVILAAGLCGFAWYINEYGEEPTVYDVATGDVSGDVAVTMSIDPNGWQNSDKNSTALWGTQYDGELFNFSKQEIKDWVISFEVPKHSAIDSDWNGVYTLEDETIRVECVDYNQHIAPDSSATFGFVMYTVGPITIDSFTVEAVRVRSLYDEPLFWILAVALFTTFVFALTNVILSVHYNRVQEKMNIYHEVSEQAMKTFARTIDAKDEYTSGHSYRVALYSRAIAERMGLSGDEREKIYYTALLHDIGKIAIPDSILTKPGKLTDEEFEQIKKHTVSGGDILFNFSAIEGISNGARYHHEHYDGKGYMAGLRGDEIPLCARIIGVADAFDAMSSARCYRPALSKEKVLSELREGSGKQFDPDIVKHMINMIEEDKVPNS